MKETEMKYTKTKEKQTTEAIEDQFQIPASEWDKVDAYIKKGSDFKKVGTMCKGNKTKYTSRYLILKVLGLEDAALDFIAGLNGRIPYSELKALKEMPTDGIEVPEKYKSLTADKTSLKASYQANKEKFKKMHQAGPLKALSQMGIDYLLSFCDGSGKDKAEISKHAEQTGKSLQTYKPSYSWVGNNGLRWDLPLVVYMLNGKVKGTDSNCFGYVIHTLESDSGNPGYSVFIFSNGQKTYADAECDNVSTCMSWIKSNIEKTGASNESEEIKEWNDTHIPRGRVGHHATGIPKKYWIAIGDDILINNYSEFVNQSLQLKPLAGNATPSFTTQDIMKAKELALRTVKKFPDKYVFFGVDDTSRGMMTGKNHLRASVRYYYDPTVHMWNDNELFGDSEEDTVDEAEKKVSYATIVKEMTEAMKKVLVKHGIKGGDLDEVMRALDYGVFDDRNPEFCLKNELEQCDIQLVD